jgi:tetratricopeptide (TPR) repeat protein
MAAVVAVIARSAQPAARLDFVPPIWGRAIVALDAIAFYLTKVVFPIKLGIDYGRSPQWLWQSSAIYYTWILPVALLAILIIFRSRTRAVLVAAGIFVLGVLPVLGLVSFDFQAFSTVADHYLYLAMLGPALLAAWVVSRRRTRMAIPVAGVLIAMLAVRSHMQTGVWAGSRELFAHTLRVNPRSLVGNVNLASLLSREAVEATLGRDMNEAAAKFTGAIHYYRTALSIRPHDPQALIGLGNVYVRLGQPSRAIPLYTQAMEGQPPSADLHANLGRAYLVEGIHEEALRHLREALRLEPGHPTAEVDLTTTLKRMGGSPASGPAEE